LIDLKIMASRRKPAFFYEGGGRNKVLSQIHHCVQFNPGVIALTGPTGSGRSLVIQKLVGSFKENEADLCYLSEDSVVLETEEELFRALAEGFGLEQKPIEMLEDIIDRVEHFVRLGLNNKRMMLIVVDDAKQHSDNVLGVLLQLTCNIKGLNLLLSGESSFIETLAQRYTPPVLFQQIALRPLLAEEVFDFLHQYLLHQGVSGESALKRTKLDELMGKTGGNLSLLVREAQQLISGVRVQAGHFHANWPIPHMIAFIAVIIITTLAFFYYPAGHDDGSAQRKTSAYTQSISSGKAVPDLAESTSTKTVKQEEHMSDKQAALLVPAPPSGVTLQSIANEPSHNTPKNLIQKQSSYTVEEQVLLNRPVGNITLQVMNLSSEKTLKDLIEQSGVADKSVMSYYRRGSGGSASYVLLYGDYPDKQQAMQAQKILPAVFKKSQPWPRPIVEIQRELRQRQ
jgi:type II secretory pathway predicted ATPase ExeA